METKKRAAGLEGRIKEKREEAGSLSPDTACNNQLSNLFTDVRLVKERNERREYEY